MEKRTKNFITILLVVLLVIGLVLVCFQLNYLYHKNWIMGKTSAEIQERYGQFDQTGMPVSADGLYRGCICSYFVTKERVAKPLIMFSIGFNKSGIAYECCFEKGPKGG